LIGQMNIQGSPWVGVFCAAGPEVTLVPPRTPPIKTLGPQIPITMGGSGLLGALVAINGHGAMVADFALDAEIALLAEAGLRVARSPGNLNAAGNLVLMNDHGALVHPGFTASTMGLMKEVFGVDVAKGEIAGIGTVASAAVVTNRGCLCHPDASDAERAMLRRLFDVPVSAGTVGGSPWVGAGLVANDHGALTGTHTTGLELGRIEEALF